MVWRINGGIFFAYCCMLVSGCNDQNSTANLAIESPCSPHDGLRTICGLRAPQDLAVLPDASGLLISEYGYSDTDGRLSFFDINNQQLRLAYNSNSSNDMSTNNAIWGEADCQEPIHFSPAGIDISQRPSGRWQLLAINRGAAQTVEFFELSKSVSHYTGSNQENRWALTWRGCVFVENNTQLSDLAATYNGFTASQNIIDDQDNWPQQLNPWPKTDSLPLSHWSLQQGWKTIANSESQPQGSIAYAATPPRYFYSASDKKSIRAIDSRQGQQTLHFEIANSAHSSWVDKRRTQLLAISQRASSYRVNRCIKQTNSACNNAFNIIQFDTASGKGQTILHSDGHYFGGASSVVQIEQTLYIGAFAGQRILIAPLGYGVNQ